MVEIGVHKKSGNCKRFDLLGTKTSLPSNIKLIIQLIKYKKNIKHVYKITG